MSDVESVWKIKVDDSEAEQWISLFNSYNEAVKENEDVLKGTVGVQNQIARGFEKQTAALLAQRELHFQMRREAEEAEKKEQKIRDAKTRAEQQALRQQRQVEKERKQAITTALNGAKGVLGVVKKTAEYVAFGGLGALITSGFGLGAFTSSVAGAGRNATRLGVTPGDVAALNVGFSRYADVNTELASASEAQLDVRQQTGYRTLGINPNGKNPADLLLDAIPKLAQKFSQMMHTNPGTAGILADAYGWTKIASLADLRGYASAYDQGQLGPLLRQAQIDRGRLNIAPNVLAGHQAFEAELKRFGYNFEAAFAPLVNKWLPGLTDGLKDVEKWMDGFVQRKDVQDAAQRFGDDLKKLADKAAKFIEGGGLDKLEHGVVLIADEIMAVAERLKWLLPDQAKNAGQTSDVQGNGSTKAFGDYRNIGVSDGPTINNPGNLRDASGTKFLKFATEREGVGAMADQLRRYESQAKWGHADTLSKIIGLYAPHKDKNGKVINDTDAYIRDVVKQTGLDPNKHLDLNDLRTLSTVVWAMARHESPKTMHRGGFDAVTAPNIMAMIQSEHQQARSRSFEQKADANADKAMAQANSTTPRAPSPQAKKEAWSAAAGQRGQPQAAAPSGAPAASGAVVTPSSYASNPKNVTFKVILDNRTGASPVVSMSQLAV